MTSVAIKQETECTV